MFRDGGDRRSFSIARDVTVIGRREDCDFRIPLGEISRKHCRLVKDNGDLRVEDLGSSNGTFVNGKRVQSAAIQAGDTLQCGSVVFGVQIDGSPDVEDLRPIHAGEAVPKGPPDEAGHLSPTDQSEVESFDPMAILGSDGSGAGVEPIDLDDSGGLKLDSQSSQSIIPLEDSQHE
jgi:predicted component of type VI protein secretion system